MNLISKGEQKSKFVLGGAAFKSVVSGERISNETIPVVEVSSQLNKFRINKLAAEMMNVTSGNKVKILITDLPVAAGKYLIAVTSDTDESAAKLLSPSGKDGFGSLLFNYSGVWSRMTQSDIEDAKELGIDFFVEAGEAVKRGKTGYVNRKVAYTIEEIEDVNTENPLVDPFTKEEYTRVFALTVPKVEAVDITKEAKPRAAKVEGAEVEAEVEAEVDVEDME